MRPAALVAIGVAGYVAFAAATIPARFALERAKAWLPPRTEIRNAEGTLWNGRADVALHSGFAVVALHPVEWHWLPSRLLSGRVAFQWRTEASGAELHGEVARSLGSWHLRDASAHGELAAIAASIPMLAQFHPQGAIDAAIDELAWQGTEGNGTARVELRGMSTSLSDVRPLGDYRLQLRVEGGAATGAVSTLRGPLQVSGEAKVSATGAATFRGEARAEPASARALEPLLQRMGTRRADGAYAIEWR